MPSRKKTPSLIFYSMQNSGSSAITPIIEELLALKGYNFPGFGPEGTEKLYDTVSQGKLLPPFYHWTHSSANELKNFFNNPCCKFVALHRDPRDVAISFTHLVKSDTGTPKPIELILEGVTDASLPSHTHNASSWLNQRCLTITFKQIKNDIQSVIFSILDHIDFFSNTEPSQQEIAITKSIINKHRYENISGRKRGENGPIIRGRYMHRKGISGEWKSVFSPALLTKVNDKILPEIEALGYERVDHLFHMVSPPFSCGIAWLVNALLFLDIKQSNLSLEPDPWDTDHGQSNLKSKSLDHLKWHLPVLQHKNSFNFRDYKEVIWEHRLDFANIYGRPTILMLRDPRDAIYSYYRRHYDDTMNFENYLDLDDVWPDHFPALFQLPPFETYAYFSLFWFSMSQTRSICLVSFEEIRESPEKVLKEILVFLDIQRSDKEISSAVTSSSSENARKSMQNTAKISGKSFKTVRKGLAGEWKTSYSKQALNRYTGPIKDLFGENGQLNIDAATPFLLDYKLLLKDAMGEKLYDISVRLVNLSINKMSPKGRGIISIIIDNQLTNTEILLLSGILQSIAYTEAIFENMQSEMAQHALNVFINLTIFYIGHEPISKSLKQRIKTLNHAACEL